MTQFIQEHPALVGAVFGLLLSFCGILVAILWKGIGLRLEKLERTDAELGRRVSAVEDTLIEYKEHIGAGDRMFKQLMDRVERHMTEEEDQVWGGMKDLGEKLSLIHEDNLRAHTAIVERVAKIEAKLPNGELNKLINMVQTLVDRK